MDLEEVLQARKVNENRYFDLSKMLSVFVKSVLFILGYVLLFNRFIFVG